ncbi:SGNH/GDSL hydrolase family protein [Parabacteroides pacaensis]|uniref:SGNH/GDSL hydrolase family protein n=1 Tax=Parabacteroides pacaensis TaxID=2086575 RepID=UPI001F2D0C6D|nr:SGNH/GDSL hydrolase family protein [Parabacteroides pacaensis]
MNSLKIKQVYIYLLITLMMCNANAFGQEKQDKQPTIILYDQVLNNKKTYVDLIMNEGTAAYLPEGLSIRKTGDLVRLHRFYALAERKVRYYVKFSEDAKALFQSDKGDFKVYIDVPNKRIGMQVNFVKERKIEFLDPEHEYLVEIIRQYNTSKAKIIDLYTGEELEIQATNDSTGGYGVGTVNQGISVGRQYDYYCFGLSEGTELLVKQITVLAADCNLTVLIYGDSITEPEGYYPENLYEQSWVQLIKKNIKGKVISSGRGGTTIHELLERIKNELPYIKSKYVMVTIGTNGENTEKNLSELIEYILSQGSIPILNNIPCNEHNSQIEVNAVIEKIRQKYGIKGCRFDLVTSLNHDGKKVDTTTMWHEDWGTNGTYFHHPNVKGSRLMYLRTLVDIPEIYE